MSNFFRLIIFLTIGSTVVLPILASENGWGLKTQTNPAVIQERLQNCPDYQKDSFGRCKAYLRSRTHRSFLGGSRTFGK